MKLKKANDDKRELIQKLEWTEKFWKDKLTSFEKQKSSNEQKTENLQNEISKLQDLLKISHNEYFFLLFHLIKCIRKIKQKFRID